MHPKDSKNDKRSTYGLAMVVIGACIGSGVFLTPQIVASLVGSEWYTLLAWGLGSLIVLSGALTFSELAGLFPSAGGVYVYLKEAYGKRLAFLYGWSTLTVITSGAIAAISLACADYTNQFIGNKLSEKGVVVLAVGIILFNTSIHTLGIKVGEIFNNIITGAKVIGIIVVIFIGLAFVSDFTSTTITSPIESSTDSIWIAMGLAMIPIMWSFGGFQHGTFLAAEAKDPKKSVGRAMIGGVLLVAVLYVLMNVVLIQVMGMESLMVSERPAYEAIQSIFSWGGDLVVLLIIIATFGSAFIFTMSAPRIYYAMAVDQVFFSWMAKKHQRFNTPVNAIVLQSVWSIVLLLFWGTFLELINYATFLEWVFLLLAGIAVFQFRKKYSISRYSFRSPFYPVLTVVFSLAVIGFLAVVVSAGNKPAIYGLSVLGIGLLCYELFKRSKSRNH